MLDDIRDTAGAEWYAAFEYVDAKGSKQIVTQSGAIALHPEERLWNRLSAAGIEPEQVLRIRGASRTARDVPRACPAT
ncbi:nucleic acid/nucleotide deaminase domain-containing protein [Streptomyces sp. NPDC004012]